MTRDGDGSGPLPTTVDTPERALSVLAGACPELRAQRAVDQGVSWFSYAYLVDETWIFRFPRTDGAERAYRKERLLLPRLAPRVRVEVPAIEYALPLADGRTFLGHRAIRGSALTRAAVDRMSAERRDAVAGEIAEFLCAMHTIPVDEARTIGADEDESALSGETERYWADARRKLYPLLSGAAGNECDALIESYLHDRANFRYTPVLRHADLWGRHILLDESPSVAGVIDYGCVCLGDPDYDFFPLLFDAGEEFMRQTLSAYGHGDADRAVRKGRFFGALDAIDTWLTGLDESSRWKVEDGRGRLVAALLVAN